MKTTTVKVAEAYALLDRASHSEMGSAERVALIRAMRPMKRVAEDFNGFRQDAARRLMPEGFDSIADRINEFNAMSQDERRAALEKREYVDALTSNARFNANVEECIADEGAKEVELGSGPVPEETFAKLLDSNPEWTLGQAMLLQDILCGKED